MHRSIFAVAICVVVLNCVFFAGCGTRVPCAGCAPGYTLTNPSIPDGGRTDAGLTAEACHQLCPTSAFGCPLTDTADGGLTVECTPQCGC